jgi:PKD repeat protein
MKHTFLLLFFLFLFPASALGAVFINEIAWMGTAASANDEWIELYNNGSERIDLAGWRILDLVNGAPDITIGEDCSTTSILAGGYYILERTDDESVPGIAADCLYVGALSNTSEHMQLYNSAGSVVDSINAVDGWPAGDNSTKETLQRYNSGWVTANATPRAVHAPDGANEEQGGAPEITAHTAGSDSVPGETTGGGGDKPYVQPEDLPHITARAGEDTSAVVGEEIQFHAEAWGLTNEHLENARYIWNFGNGSTGEGQNVLHAYMYPGSYVVQLSVSSGKYAASDTLTVVVGKNQLTVSEVFPGPDGWIELHNAGFQQVHIGNWIVETSRHRFIMPRGTTISSQSFAALSAKTTGLVLLETGDNAHMYYPNGSYATGISYVFQVPAGKSVSIVDNAAVFTEPTPGEQNTAASTAMKTDIMVAVSGITNSPPKNIIPAPRAAVPKTERRETTADTDDESKQKNPAPAIQNQLASAVNAPVFTKKYENSLWFAGSLVTGGLCAVGVVLFQRRRNRS